MRFSGWLRVVRHNFFLLASHSTTYSVFLTLISITSCQSTISCWLCANTLSKQTFIECLLCLLYEHISAAEYCTLSLFSFLDFSLLYIIPSPLHFTVFVALTPQLRPTMLLNYIYNHSPHRAQSSTALPPNCTHKSGPFTSSLQPTPSINHESAWHLSSTAHLILRPVTLIRLSLSPS
jgi:hypothetical protein